MHPAAAALLQAAALQSSAGSPATHVILVNPPNLKLPTNMASPIMVGDTAVSKKTVSQSPCTALTAGNLPPRVEYKRCLNLGKWQK